jgi:ribonuclease E
MFALAAVVGAPFSVAQAQTLPTQVAADVQTAVAAGDTAKLQQLVKEHPTLAAPIAQAAATQAASIAASSPAAAASVATFANGIAASIAVSNPSAASAIVVATAQVASTPAVMSVAPAAAASVASGAASVASQSAVAAANPAAAAAIAQQVVTVASNPAVIAAAPSGRSGGDECRRRSRTIERSPSCAVHCLSSDHRSQQCEEQSPRGERAGGDARD